jgi:hypothetical protein
MSTNAGWLKHNEVDGHNAALCGVSQPAREI